MNDYALKFAREAYEDAERDHHTSAEKLAELKAEYNRQRRIFFVDLSRKL